MPLTAAQIVTRASMILQDPSQIRWPLTEMVNYLNDARREIAVIKPDVYTAMLEGASGHPCDEGARQKLPTGGLRLVDVPRNSSGIAVTVTQRGWLDQQRPNWQLDSKQTTVRHFAIDERNPTTFWVYPPVVSGTKIDLVYLKAPTDFAVTGPNAEGIYTSTGGDASTAGELTAQESLYGGAMVDYICYRGFSKDSEYAGDAQRAIAHYQQFAAALGISRKIDLTNSANLANVGGVPSKQVATEG